ncbi:unnamed protein product [Penicillium glandicola]
MEISDQSENDENGLTSQTRPPANTTRARAPRTRGPASGARAPAAPSAASAPSAVNSSKPTGQLKPILPKMRRSDERFLLPELRYNVMTNASIYESLKSYLNLNVFSSFYSIVSRYLGSLNSRRSSPAANHYGVAGMPTISSMYTNLIKSPSTQIDVRKATETMAGMDAYRRNLYMLSLYTEERLFLDKMSYSSIWKSSLSSQVTGVPAQEHWAHLTPSALRAMMFRSMDEVFAAIPISAKPDYVAARDVIHHVLCLLRQVSLQMLESFSGWQAEDAEANTSTNQLKHWMENNPSSARKCLWHAVCVFSTLKAKQKFACHDPLCFLIAFFYIWAFDTLVVAPEIEKPQASNKEIRLLDTREIQIWIAEGPNTPLNLVGVGNLTGKGSSLRLLTEVFQIFLKRKSWSGLCRGLASAVDQILDKQTTPQEVPQRPPGDSDTQVA